MTNLFALFVAVLAATASESASLRSPHKPAKATELTITVPNARILAASNALSTKQAVDEDFKTQLSTSMSWEPLLSPAPLTIGLLGDLMIMSSQTRDFPIDGELPKSGAIQYVKYPKSFRTTLVQIGNEGQRAFMVAHNNMDKIRLLTGGVPAYMKEATEILVTGDEELVADYLPAPMNRIREAAQSSVSLSKAVVWQFEHVMNLTAEVLEMCTSEKSLQEANLKEAIKRQTILNMTIPSFQQMVDQLNTSVIRDTAVMDRAEEDMRKALREMPSGWEMIAMDFVQNVGDLVTTTLKTVTTVSGVFADGRRDSGTDQTESSDATILDDFSSQPGGLDPCVIQHRKDVVSLEGLAKSLRQSYPNLESIDSASQGQYDPATDERILEKISVDVELCQPIADVVDQGLDFIRRLSELAKVQKPDNITEEEFATSRRFDFFQVLDVVKEFKRSTTQLKQWVSANQQAIANNTPLMNRARNKIANKGSASQQTLANCRYRADMAQATLLTTRKSMEKARADMMEQNHEFIKLLTEQQSLNLDKVRYDEIIKALQEGLKKLAILKEHWTKLVLFFQKIANIVENVAVRSIQDFANHAEITSLRLKNIHKELVIDSLYTKALKATQASSLVKDMAEIYVNVSQRYIMPSVSSLSKLIVTDPKEAVTLRSNLLTKCADDSQAIVDLIVAEKEQVVWKLEQRSKQIKKEYAFLDEIKRNQIELLRQKAEMDFIQEGGKKVTEEEQTTRIEQVVRRQIDEDEFLRDNNILDDEDDDQVINANDF